MWNVCIVSKVFWYISRKKTRRKRTRASRFFPMIFFFTLLPANKGSPFLELLLRFLYATEVVGFPALRGRKSSAVSGSRGDCFYKTDSHNKLPLSQPSNIRRVVCKGIIYNTYVNTLFYWEEMERASRTKNTLLWSHFYFLLVPKYLLPLHVHLAQG